MQAMAGTVILVEDDDAVRNALKFALEVEGLDVRAYTGAEELLRQVALPRRGCLVVDYAMPSMNGVELVHKLRERDVSLPALLITGKATRQVRKLALEAGFSEVLEKPLDDGAFLDSLRSVLARETNVAP